MYFHVFTERPLKSGNLPVGGDNIAYYTVKYLFSERGDIGSPKTLMRSLLAKKFGLIGLLGSGKAGKFFNFSCNFKRSCCTLMASHFWRQVVANLLIPAKRFNFAAFENLYMLWLLPPFAEAIDSTGKLGLIYVYVNYAGS
jgi:hypothetical protein